MVEAQLESRRWEREKGESVDGYHSALVELGAKINRNGDDLCTAFLRGIPDACRVFVMGADTHTLDVYLRRAKLWHSQNATSAAASVSAPATVDINSVTQQLCACSVSDRGEYARQSGSRMRSRSSDRGDDIRCYNCQGVGHMQSECPSRRSRGQKDSDRRRSPARRDSRSRDRNDRRRTDSRRCYVCGETGHIASRCSQRKGSSRESSQDGSKNSR